VSFDLTRQFLGDAILGLFGAGHLGRGVAEGLLDGGFPRRNLAICHRESRETEGELAAAGLSDLVVGREQVVGQSRILFYLV
jgi:pyrroline-5-carboxylate reductase